MKHFALGLSLICSNALGQSQDVCHFRTMYYASSLSKKDAEKFYEHMNKLNKVDEPLTLGYRGTATVIMAKYLLNPYDKYRYFKRGSRLVDQAIGKDTLNIESRFLRYCIQTNAPWFLDYHSCINQDKAMILKALRHLEDKDLKSRIVKYLSVSKYCTANEKNEFL